MASLNPSDQYSQLTFCPDSTEVPSESTNKGNLRAEESMASGDGRNRERAISQ